MLSLETQQDPLTNPNRVSLPKDDAQKKEPERFKILNLDNLSETKKEVKEACKSNNNTKIGHFIEDAKKLNDLTKSLLNNLLIPDFNPTTNPKSLSVSKQIKRKREDLEEVAKIAKVAKKELDRKSGQVSNTENLDTFMTDVKTTVSLLTQKEPLASRSDKYTELLRKISLNHLLSMQDKPFHEQPQLFKAFVDFLASKEIFQPNKEQLQTAYLDFVIFLIKSLVKNELSQNTLENYIKGMGKFKKLSQVESEQLLNTQIQELQKPYHSPLAKKQRELAHIMDKIKGGRPVNVGFHLPDNVPPSWIWNHRKLLFLEMLNSIPGSTNIELLKPINFLQTKSELNNYGLPLDFPPVIEQKQGYRGIDSSVVEFTARGTTYRHINYNPSSTKATSPKSTTKKSLKNPKPPESNEIKRFEANIRAFLQDQKLFLSQDSMIMCDIPRLPLDKLAPSAVLADGSGHGQGSQTAASTASVIAQNSFNTWSGSKNAASLREIMGAMIAAVLDGHAAICKIDRDKYSSCLTTLAMAVIVDGYLLVCSVGDCKVFLARKTTTPEEKILVEDLTDAARDQSASKRDPGGQLGWFEDDKANLSNLSVSVMPIQKGDLVFLVTDGVHDNFDPETLGKSPEEFGLVGKDWSYSKNSPHVAKRKEMIRRTIEGFLQDQTKIKETIVSIQNDQKAMEMLQGAISSGKTTLELEALKRVIEEYLTNAVHEFNLASLLGAKTNGISGKHDHAGFIILQYLGVEPVEKGKKQDTLR